MTEIKTTQFSWTVDESINSHQIYNRNASRKFVLIVILVMFLLFLSVAYPLIIAAMFFPQARAGILPYLLKVLKEEQFIFWPFLGLLVLEFILLPLFVRFRIWQSFQGNKKLYNDIEIHFTEQGIEWVRSNASSHFDWSYFQAVIDHKKYFLLVYGKNLYSAIPKRILSESQIPALTEMLKSHIGKYEVRG